MRKLFKRGVSFFLIPFTRWYLRKERKHRYRDVEVSVMPGVFHPGLFYSTGFILDYVIALPLRGKKLLELGCGSGLVSVIAAKMNAIVTATDISLRAIENTKANLSRNHVSAEVIMSDLFANLALQTFDVIIINPPYYPIDPKEEQDYAWYCGSDFEYFRRLFASIGKYVNRQSTVIMVLTKGSKINTIQQIARMNGIEFELLREKNVLFDEKDFLFQLKTKGTP